MVEVILVTSTIIAACFVSRAAAGTIPTYVWPLGEGILTTEVKTNFQSGGTNNTSYIQGPVANGLDYQAFQFSGPTSASYVEVEVPDNVALHVDMTFVFLVYFDAVSEGTIFHLKSDDLGALDSITEIELSLTPGGLLLYMAGDGDITVSAPWVNSAETLAVPFVAGQWYAVGLERDLNKDLMALYIDGTIYRTAAIFAKDTPIKLPAVLRMGGSQNSVINSIGGRVTCLAIAAARFNYFSVPDVDDLLTACKTVSWGAGVPRGGCAGGCAYQDAMFTLSSTGCAPMSVFTLLDSDPDTSSRECAANCKKSSLCMSFAYNKELRSCRLYDGIYGLFTELTHDSDRYYIRNDTCCP